MPIGASKCQRRVIGALGCENRLVSDKIVFRSPDRIKSGKFYIWIGLAYAAIVLILITVLPRTPPALLPLAFLGPSWALLGAVQLRTRVELDEGALTIYSPPLLRPRSVRWRDVHDLRLDPPGGTRQIRLRLSSGAEVSLPPLTDADHDAVRRSFEAASANGSER